MALSDRLMTSLYAANKADWASITAWSFTWTVPLISDGSIPSAEPGDNPTLPLIWSPAPLIAAVARIAKVEAAPRLTDFEFGFGLSCAPVVKLQTKLVAILFS